MSKYLPLVFPVLLLSCIPPVGEKPEDNRSLSTGYTDLLTLARSLPYFAQYIEAVEKNYLEDILAEESPLTAFLPNENAVNSFLKNKNISRLDELPREKLSEILLYHLISGQFQLLRLPTGYYNTYSLEKKTGNPLDLYVNTDRLFKLNGKVCLDEPDLPAENGIIHSISIVLEPPTVLDHLAVNENFSTLWEGLNRVLPDPEFKDLFAEENLITVFAPTNEAFSEFFEKNPEFVSISKIPVDTLKEILKPYIVPGDNMVIGDKNISIRWPTLTGDSLTIVKTDKKTTLTIKNTSVNISIRDIQGTTGILHQIDQLIRP